VYASGGLWLSSSIDELQREAADFVAAGFRAVKMRVAPGKPAVKWRDGGSSAARQMSASGATYAFGRRPLSCAYRKRIAMWALERRASNAGPDFDSKDHLTQFNRPRRTR
jgi:hypothetical protein